MIAILSYMILAAFSLAASEARAPEADIAGTWEFVQIAKGQEHLSPDMRRVDVYSAFVFTWVARDRHVGSLTVNTVVNNEDPAKKRQEFFQGFFILTAAGEREFILDLFVGKPVRQNPDFAPAIHNETDHAVLRLRIIDRTAIELSGTKGMMKLRRVRD